MVDNVKSVNLVYYSPTGTSKKIAWAIGDGLRVNDLKESDMTYSNNVIDKFSEDSLTVFVSPVYGGRVPSVFFDRLGSLEGNGARCVVVVVYGNRHYDDALLELKNAVENQGFKPVAAAAFIGEHSFSRSDMPIAKGRPDCCDISMAEHFGKEVMDKINTVSESPELYVPGNMPYKELKPKQNVSPLSLESCSQCGLCVSPCPTGAIYMDSMKGVCTEQEKCTLCCACVKACPSGARVFDTPFTKFLCENFSERRNPEFFF